LQTSQIFGLANCSHLDVFFKVTECTMPFDCIHHTDSHSHPNKVVTNRPWLAKLRIHGC